MFTETETTALYIHIHFYSIQFMQTQSIQDMCFVDAAFSKNNYIFFVNKNSKKQHFDNIAIFKHGR